MAEGSALVYNKVSFTGNTEQAVPLLDSPSPLLRAALHEVPGEQGVITDYV